MSLKEAQDENRKHLANDIDPSKFRKTKKIARLDTNASNFELIALKWHSKQIL